MAEQSLTQSEKDEWLGEIAKALDDLREELRTKEEMLAEVSDELSRVKSIIRQTEWNDENYYDPDKKRELAAARAARGPLAAKVSKYEQRIKELQANIVRRMDERSRVKLRKVD